MKKLNLWTIALFAALGRLTAPAGSVVLANDNPPPPPGGAKQSDADRIKQLESENEALRKQVELDQEAAAQRAKDEKLIADKMAVGLTRDQALAVIQRQKDHDQALAKKIADRLPRLQQIIKANADPISARKAARVEFPDLEGGEFAAAIDSLKKK